MKVFTFFKDHFENARDPFSAQSILPKHSIVLQRTPFTVDTRQDWSNFYLACKTLQQQIKTPEWVLIDASWDPFSFNSEQIQQARLRLSEIFDRSKILVLSAAARHFYEYIPGCVYFPMFLMVNYPALEFKPRAGRIGCLNRRNALHRIFLMHHLIKNKLIDDQRDIFSVSFVNPYTGNEFNFTGHDAFQEIGQDIKSWPKSIATHDDGFINDYSINHPAWHTGISIITETEPGVDTIVCEKTAKGILSKSCFSVYMAEVGYRVLDDLGFEVRFFPDHAEEFNIQPIVDICKTITTESQALEYRQQHIDKIEHNFEWFAINTGPFQSRPWWNRYEPKLRQALDSL